LGADVVRNFTRAKHITSNQKRKGFKWMNGTEIRERDASRSELFHATKIYDADL
jgi:hypothetical protein